ncbi:DUF4221 family protein [Algoriphagus resistens]|uniref:DUF4221 family protein n=1 Tax=Algoriphagus resistens TaxID=1750590 RepID=UPI000716B808|nr:DUF4221 family protein [Algoriphagus resistens]
MKNLLTISILAFLTSCGGKVSDSSVNILEELSYTIDTVMVNSGEDFLNLSGGLGEYGLSRDKTRLFFFESKPPKLVEVDLEKMKVLKKTEFEVEGPDGMGSYVSKMEIGPNGNLFLNSYVTTGIFNQNGNKIQDLKFVPSGIDTALAQNYRALYFRAVYDFENRKIFTQPTFQDAGEYSLFILNPETQSARSLPIPKMKIVDDYSGTLLSESGMISFYGVGAYFTFFPGELFVTTSAMSGIYRYNTQTEKLEFIDIQHKTVPNKMDFELIKNPTEVAQISENQTKIFEHINYWELMWDDSRKMYFRFGVKTFEGEFKDDPYTLEPYLFAYDKDFNVLGETKVERLTSVPSSSFFKDGKLYSYVNIEDELGFAVFTFNF